MERVRVDLERLNSRTSSCGNFVDFLAHSKTGYLAIYLRKIERESRFNIWRENEEERESGFLQTFVNLFRGQTAGGKYLFCLIKNP